MNNSICLSTGPHGSMHEQNIDFEGMHQDKQKIKCKSEGDVFMANCYCDNGFTNSFHFRKMIHLINCTRLKLSTLHSRVLGLFHAFPDINYKHWVDNLHAFVNFVA